MITLNWISESRKQDINIPNEPFLEFGRMIPSYTEQSWSYRVETWPEEQQRMECFPDENYDYDAMKEQYLFLGAYDGEQCIGLAIFRHHWAKYLYLHDLKVNKAYRSLGVGKMLMEEGGKMALSKGYRGIYTVGQDSNLAACKFYIKCGFEIGGFNTHVYNGTALDGTGDIFFYWDIEK